MSEIDRIFRWPDVTGRWRPPGLITSSAEFALWQFLRFSGIWGVGLPHYKIRRWNASRFWGAFAAVITPICYYTLCAVCDTELRTLNSFFAIVTRRCAVSRKKEQILAYFLRL